MKPHSLAAWIFVGPALVAIAVFFAVPVAAALLMSLTDFDIYALADLSNLRFVGLDNYSALLQRPLFWQALWNTVIFVAIGVPLLNITAVQFKGGIVAQAVSASHPQILVALQCAALGAGGFKQIHRDARGYTGLAVAAMWPIDMVATAAKAEHREVAVQGLVDLLAWIDKQGGGLLVFQVATTMGIGGVHLEISEG